MLNPANQPYFRLSLNDYPHDLLVLSFTGREAISQPYRFDLQLVCERADLDLEDLLHRQAFLALDPQGTGIHGQICSVAQQAPGRRLNHYRISLVPHLHYLGYRRNQRIFQHLSAPAIIARILEEHGILADTYRFHLGKPCPEREYCVQYAESDLQFIQRLCEEEGLHYHFQHQQDAHHLVFGDDQTVFPKLGRPTPYVPDSGLEVSEPVIRQFDLRLETRSGRVTRRDYSFEKPHIQLQADSALISELPASTLENHLEDYAYPGHFDNETRGRLLSQRALQRHRADYQQAEGRSDQPRLCSGHFLSLSEHPQSEWNDLWLLTAVEHEGRQPQVLEESMPDAWHNNGDDWQQGYRNHFTATPWAVHYRPALRNPKPKVPSSQTAFVTGPPGEEIHCDEYGRVKVQFHWDRDGQGNERSSCWLRVASGWAGAHYGGMAVPRVGMEVLVTFLENDPDQPLISGFLYNKTHPMPYPLPAHKTRSVFKSLSSPGGGGSNELRIEDRKGAEQIYLHTQRDWQQQINNDQTVTVGHQRFETVEGNSHSEFKTEEHCTVHADRRVQVRGDDHLSVGHTQHINVQGAYLSRAGQDIHLQAGDTIVVDAGAELTIKAGGHFIKLDPGGISMSTPMIVQPLKNLATREVPAAPTLPTPPKVAIRTASGETLAPAPAGPGEPVGSPYTTDTAALIVDAWGNPEQDSQIFMGNLEKPA